MKNPLFCAACNALVPVAQQVVGKAVGGAIGGALGLRARSPVAAVVATLVGAVVGHVIDEAAAPICGHCRTRLAAARPA